MSPRGAALSPLPPEHRADVPREDRGVWGLAPSLLQHPKPSPQLCVGPRWPQPRVAPAKGGLSLVTVLSSRRSHLAHATLHRHFTFLTLRGVWGLSTRRLTGVRGVLPYSISASICRLFFSCCTKDQCLQTEQRMAQSWRTEPLPMSRPCGGLRVTGSQS